MKTRTPHRRIKEGTAILAFYLFFSVLYYITLYVNQDLTQGFLTLLSLEKYWGTAGMQYFLFFLASIPVWFLVFRLLANKKLYLRLLALLIIMLPLLYGTRFIYYRINDHFGWGHLTGTGTVWDIYIPGLFMMIQFGFLFAYEHYRENQEKLRIEGELRQAALKSELSAIKAQLNPHFLYNVFNTINASVPAENEKTRQLIAELSDLFRYQLQATKEDLVPLKNEISFVEKYLDLEKARFEERLKVKIEVEEGLMEEKVPPMILQPLVENCVKHGLSPLIQGGEIRIKISREDEKLKFIVSDTGIGIKDKESIFDSGIGLHNTRQRLHKMYNSTVEVSDNHPNGLTISFSI